VTHPGFNKVRIEPHPGQLKNIAGYMPHPKEKSVLNIHKPPSGKWNFNIQLPQSITGVFIWKGKQHVLHGGNNSFEL
jgi:hypothetical protein